MEQFVIVTEEGDGSFSKDTVFHFANTERAAVSRVTDLSSQDSEVSTEVVRVFAFNEYGRVTHYELRLKGFKLVLEAAAEESETAR